MKEKLRALRAFVVKKLIFEHWIKKWTPETRRLFWENQDKYLAAGDCMLDRTGIMDCQHCRARDVFELDGHDMINLTETECPKCGDKNIPGHSFANIYTGTAARAEKERSEYGIHRKMLDELRLRSELYRAVNNFIGAVDRSVKLLRLKWRMRYE